MIPSVQLSNNINIPLLGLGLWQINDKDVMTEVLQSAFDIGYTMIDTASVYSNELAIRKSLSSITPPP